MRYVVTAVCRYLLITALLWQDVCCQSGETDARQIGLIAGCVGGGVILLVLIVIVCCIACSKDRKNSKFDHATKNKLTYPSYTSFNGTHDNKISSSLYSGTAKDSEFGLINFQYQGSKSEEELKNGGLDIAHKTSATLDKNAKNKSKPEESSFTKSTKSLTATEKQSNSSISNSLEMSSGYPVPGPGVWTSNSALFVDSFPGLAYQLAEDRDSGVLHEDKHLSSREHPDFYNSYSNEPMLTPKKSNWYNRTLRRAQNALRQIPAVFQVKSSNKESLAFYKEEQRKTPVMSQKLSDTPILRDKSNRPRSTDSNRQRTNQRHSFPTQPNSRSVEPITVIQSPPESEIARVHTGFVNTSPNGNQFRHSYSSVIDRIEETDEENTSAPSGPFVAKAYSNYQPPMEDTSRTTKKAHFASQSLDTLNVTSAYNSYGNLKSRDYQKDPYVARVNVRNSADIGLSRPQRSEIRSDRSLNRTRSSSDKKHLHINSKNPKAPRRTKSEMVKGGAGKFKQDGGKKAPLQAVSNQVLITPNGPIPIVEFVGDSSTFGNRMPYSRGVFMGKAYGGEINRRQAYSLDRHQQKKHQQSRGAVFVAPDEDTRHINTDNFILRSNTYSTKNSSAKANQSSLKPVARHNSSAVNKKEEVIKNKKQQTGANTSHHQSPTSSAQDIVHNLENKPVSESDDDVMKRFQVHHLRSSHHPPEDPHALYAKPIKIKRDNSFLERLAKDENDNQIPLPKPVNSSKPNKQSNITEQTATSTFKKEDEIEADIYPIFPSTETSAPVKTTNNETQISVVSSQTEEKKQTEDVLTTPVESRKRLKSVSSADIALKGKDVTTDAFKFLEDYMY